MLAVSAAALLVATGILITVAQLERPSALIGTDCGRSLLGKLVGVAGLIALAAWNRLRLTPALDVGSLYAAGCLGRGIGVEVASAGLVLAATSSLTLAVPPRVLMRGTIPRITISPPRALAVAAEAGGLLARIKSCVAVLRRAGSPLR